MQVQAPKGQFRVIGLDAIDRLTSPSGPFSKDCETLEEAVELADRSGQLYCWTYVYDDNGELLYEAGFGMEHIEKLNQEGPAGSKTDIPKNPQ